MVFLKVVSIAAGIFTFGAIGYTAHDIISEPNNIAGAGPAEVPTEEHKEEPESSGQTFLITQEYDLRDATTLEELEASGLHLMENEALTLAVDHTPTKGHKWLYNDECEDIVNVRSSGFTLYELGGDSSHDAVGMYEITVEGISAGECTLMMAYADESEFDWEMNLDAEQILIWDVVVEAVHEPAEADEAFLGH